uniref:Uncharacterized protein n=1 Tax=Anopheles minimus TaxID=112268 RepID=A0A182WQA3_9DIPT
MIPSKRKPKTFDRTEYPAPEKIPGFSARCTPGMRYGTTGGSWADAERRQRLAVWAQPPAVPVGQPSWERPSLGRPSSWSVPPSTEGDLGIFSLPSVISLMSSSLGTAGATGTLSSSTGVPSGRSRTTIGPVR